MDAVPRICPEEASYTEEAGHRSGVEFAEESEGSQEYEDEKEEEEYTEYSDNSADSPRDTTREDVDASVGEPSQEPTNRASDEGKTRPRPRQSPSASSLRHASPSEGQDDDQEPERNRKKKHSRKHSGDQEALGFHKDDSPVARHDAKVLDDKSSAVGRYVTALLRKTALRRWGAEVAPAEAEDEIAAIIAAARAARGLSTRRPRAGRRGRRDLGGAVRPTAMAPKRSAVVDVLARKGYYDEMTNTFEEINEKRDIVEKDRPGLAFPRTGTPGLLNVDSPKAQRTSDDVLKVLRREGLLCTHELQELVEEREELVKAIAELQARLEQIAVSNKANCKTLRKTERILRQLEQGGAVARAALRKLLLSRMTLEERVAKVREDFQLSCNWPASPVYFHGESYVAGTLDTHDWLCSALAQLSQAAVLSVEYRRPPEVRFPYLDRLYSQRSEQLAPARTQQRSLRAAGAGILESHGPVAMMPLSGAQVAHGIAIDQQKPSKVGQHSRQVKDNFVNRVVEKCGPAVVRIQTEQKVELPAIANADLFSFFFGLRPDAERKIKGQGSGFCVDAEKGVILTNAHVVQSADRITAHFAGRPGSGAHGSRGVGVECELLETDEVIDLAVLQVKEWEVHEFIAAKFDKSKLPLPAMSLGSSETVKTGDWTIVLGNPLGLQNTCTLGIVSSLDRSTGETGFDWMRHPLIQTDAAVNQGNSIISMRALFGEGIGFAIPVESIKGALPTLLARKKVPRSYIGVKSLGLHRHPCWSCRAVATGPRMKFTDDSPAVIETVLEKSPAKEAKLQEEDQILEVNGHKVRGALAMACALRARAASERGEEEVPDLRVQVLFYPWVDVRPNSDSMQSCQEDNDLHILMQEDLAFASEIYGPPRVKSSEEEEEEEEDDEPKVEEWMKVEEASPLLAGTLQNLPRTFLAYAADDLLAPDCRALVSRLRKEQGAEAVHELELPGPLGPGFAKDPTKAASYAALAAAGAFASGAFMGRS
eukprot:g29171.t1